MTRIKIICEECKPQVNYRTTEKHVIFFCRHDKSGLYALLRPLIHTDSLTPDDLQRIEDSLDTDKLRSEKELRKALTKQREGKPVFPKKLQNFLLERNKDRLIGKEEKERIRSLLHAKNKTLLDTDTIERGVWNGKATYYIKDAKHKIKTWGVDPQRKVDFRAEIKRSQENIRTHEQKIKILEAKIQKLKEAQQHAKKKPQ